jgi:hypothetical protein
MKVNRLIPAGCLLAALAAAPVIAPAASRVFTQKDEAVQVLGELRDIAHETSDQADRLSSISTLGASDWEVHSHTLQVLSDNINDMGRKLAVLQALQTAVPPERRTEIARATDIARGLAADTTRAIQFLQAHQESLWQPEYRKHTGNISKQADQLTQLLDRYDEHMRLQAKDRELRQSIAGE